MNMTRPLADVSEADLRDELTRRRCALDGHRPAQVFSAGERALSALCDCGAVQWVPQQETPQ